MLKMISLLALCAYSFLTSLTKSSTQKHKHNQSFSSENLHRILILFFSFWNYFDPNQNNRKPKHFLFMLSITIINYISSLESRLNRVLSASLSLSRSLSVSRYFLIKRNENASMHGCATAFFSFVLCHFPLFDKNVNGNKINARGILTM